jgi:hypothetical protein
MADSYQACHCIDEAFEINDDIRFDADNPESDKGVISLKN